MLWTGLRKSLNSQENQGFGIQVGKESVLSDYQTLTQGSVDLNVISQSEHQTYITEENKEVRWYIKVIRCIMTRYTKRKNAYIKADRN